MRAVCRLCIDFLRFMLALLRMLLAARVAARCALQLQLRRGGQVHFSATTSYKLAIKKLRTIMYSTRIIIIVIYQLRAPPPPAPTTHKQEVRLFVVCTAAPPALRFGASWRRDFSIDHIASLPSDCCGVPTAHCAFLAA